MREDNSNFMIQFRWITPVVVSLTGIAVTILIFVVGNLITEIRAVRVEVTETRKFAVEYTNKMVEMVMVATGEKKK